MPNEIISRDEIRNDGIIPQILITNYAMLEYLLLRPEDSVLFNSGLWKFLILDEAHTYSGAQGIEVAMLIRRLKQRLGKKQGDMLCVATSATLVDDDLNAAVEFAEKLFGEDFFEDNIIFGEEDKSHIYLSEQTDNSISAGAFLNPNFEKMLEEMRKEGDNTQEDQNTGPDVETIALWLAEIGLISEDALDDTGRYLNDLQGYLYNVLSNNQVIKKLRDWMIKKGQPIGFAETADYLFANLPDLAVEDKNKALYHLIEVAALARPAKNQLPLLPIKYHIFARSPQGIWACLNPSCPGKDKESQTNWSRIYSYPIEKCESCSAKVFPIYLCRECGQPFIVSSYEKYGCYYQPAKEKRIEEGEVRFFTWKQIIENKSLADLDDDEEVVVGTTGEKYISQSAMSLCLSCIRPTDKCKCEHKINSISLYLVQKSINNKKGEQIIPAPNLQECPRCRSKSKAGTEVITPVSVKGMGPLANLTYELYRQLPTATDEKRKSLPGQGRKLLSFYDSRQGAARFAAFLQDISNKQNYRHIIPKAIDQHMIKDEWGQATAPNLVKLSEISGDFAWKNGLIKNDVDSIYWREAKRPYSSDEKREASIWMAKKILGEFTTGRKSRQSLESMGLVGISYFKYDAEFKFDSLAQDIGLSKEKTVALLNHLLDDLRYRKAVKLPSGISADDPEFGLNKGNPRFIRQGEAKFNEALWIGKTPRQHRRQYVELVLRSNGLDYTEDDVVEKLNKIWDWLTNESNGLFSGSAKDGYQLDPRYFYFDTQQKWYRCGNCQRLSCRGDSLPCPHPLCHGQLSEFDISLFHASNYYYNIFKQPLVPIGVEEHTAQLDSERSRSYQNDFKKGYINVLSCSTTFEMGIDLGDLQSVVLSNVPPTVANYRQRSGRAGRRTSGTAYTLTWASDRPHDQAYYNAPTEIISGEVKVPNIVLENELIVQRHVNAILLSRFLRFRKSQGIESEKLTFCGDFFDEALEEKPHYMLITEWHERDSEGIKRELDEFAFLVPNSLKPLVENGFANFQNSLERIGKEHYNPISRYYREQIEQLGKLFIDTATRSAKVSNTQSRLNFYRNLLERLRGGSRRRNVGYLINYLSSNGFLPSYSFPLHTVELILPKEIKGDENLRLERDLRQAIREYAPGSEIVADKRVWRSQRPIFWNDTPQVREYRICDNCHHLEISEEVGVPLPQISRSCSVCKVDFSSKSKTRKFVTPDGFLADIKSGRPAKQFVMVEPSLMRSALIPEQNLDEEKVSDLVFLSYNQTGKLLYVNEGTFGKGFSFPLQSFAFLAKEKKEETLLSLGFVQTTNTLHIRFSSNEHPKPPAPTDQSFWLSLLYAIIHGASYSLQIERKDIDGVLFPRSKEGLWEQTIVLYDNVPGGAGHVKNIKENFIAVLEEARRVLSCNDCAPDTSCYHCLRDYDNQFFHDLLKRKPAQDYLDLLIASHNPIDPEIPGLVRVHASSVSNWLYEKIRYAQQSIAIAIENLDWGHPRGENFTWLDTISDLINKNCEVNLYLQKLPIKLTKEYSFATHLQVLLDKGIRLWKIEELPRWQIVIDPNHPAARFIGSNDSDEKIKLSDTIGARSLLTSTNEEQVRIVANDINNQIKVSVEREALNPPPSVNVLNINASTKSGINEKQLFSAFFAKPCKKILIHDPYLYSRYVLLERLDNYLAMASQHNELEDILIVTKRAQDREELKEQEKAKQELEWKYKNIIRFKYKPDHDRFIEITRHNGEKARIIIGRGIDFIQPDGSTRRTFIIIEDPLLP